MSDLAAIRARDAASDDLFDDPSFCAVVRDRRALLAEVDRLTAERSALAEFAGVIEDERARIRAAVEGLLSFDIRVDRALTPFDGPDYSGRYDMPPGEVVITALPGQGGLVDRAAVLAAIDGGGEPPLGGIEQFQDEDR